MSRKSNIIFKEWLFIIVTWIGILYLFVFISYTNEFELRGKEKGVKI